jgi:bis(5'-nucleosyl)-tetraphosphatase (symmetrical)
MATYAIGDIQGCFAEFQALLERCGVRPGQDRLWVVGDVVNRGPSSLETLRFLKQNNDWIDMVLGNHDLHLIGVSLGVRALDVGDTLQPILDAPDGPALVRWLRSQPLFRRVDNDLLVHAGLLPGWSVDEALYRADALAEVLGDDTAAKALLTRTEGQADEGVSSDSMSRFRHNLAVLTRLRACSPEGQMLMAFSGGPDALPSGYLPWFDVPGRLTSRHRVIFGHWAALGLVLQPNVVAIDTGCIWGNELTAFRLEDGSLFQQPRLGIMD